MSDTEKRDFKEQLDRIERCLTGDAEFGQMGLVSRTNNHASRIKKLENWRLYYVACVIGGAFVVGLFYKVATDWWPKK